MKLSARNQLRGTVRSINRGAAIANVEVEVAGQRVVASITVEAVDSLVSVAIGIYHDSMAIAAKRRQPGDWSVKGKDGKVAIRLPQYVACKSDDALLQLDKGLRDRLAIWAKSAPTPRRCSRARCAGASASPSAARPIYF